FLQDVQAVGIRKIDVEDDEIPRGFLNLGKRLLTCPYLGHFKLLRCIRQHLLESHPDDGVVVDEEDPELCTLGTRGLYWGLGRMDRLIRQHRSYCNWPRSISLSADTGANIEDKI